MRFLPPILPLFLLLAGCRTPLYWGDLSQPREWIELDEQPVEVVGARCLPIVTDDSPVNRWAALFLAQTISEMSGKRPEVLVERPGQRNAPTNALFVGSVCANRGFSVPSGEYNAEAFRVIASRGRVHFIGRADFAVFDWSERALGMRYYPVFGKSVIFATNVVVRAMDYSDQPLFEHREIGSGDEPWLKVSRQGSCHRGGVSVHQPHNWVTNESIKAEWPDIFENGETPMLCYGKRRTLDYYRRRIDRHIAGLEDSGGIVDSRRKVVTICQWDAPIRCACADCKRLYGANGDASPIIWGFFLRELSAWLKEAHGDYEISFLPYMNTCEVPDSLKGRLGHRRWRLLKNSEAEVCTMPGLAMFKNPETKSREERILREWARVTSRKVLNWHYLCWPADWTQAPYLFGHQIVRHYRDMADVSCGSFVCGDANDPRLALSAYVWMRALWNPNFDVEALYDDFAARLFGAGAGPMRELIAMQENCWARPWPDGRLSHHNVFEISFIRADVLRMKELVREAEALVRQSGDNAALAMIGLYASMFEEFVAESDDLAGRPGRRVIPLGQAERMVAAESALYPRPWAETTVETVRENDDLVFTVTCEEPAAALMDFSRKVNDVIWGNDSVNFVFGVSGEIGTARVLFTGEVDSTLQGFTAQVSHDATSWRVIARMRLNADLKNETTLVGNVARWRIGDRRLPIEKRVAGSRREHTRLSTAFTKHDTDPAAFVIFKTK